MIRFHSTAALLLAALVAGCTSQPVDEDDQQNGSAEPYVMAYNKISLDDESVGITLVDTNGQEIEVLPSTVDHALMSPSGNGRLALAVDEPDEVVVYDLATKTVVQRFGIDDTASLQQESVAISPDGSRLSYTVRSIDPVTAEFNQVTHLVDADSGNPLTVDVGPAQESFARFSPDGNTVAWMAHVDAQLPTAVLHLVDAADGSYTEATSVGVAGNDWFGWFGWSGDGTRIVYPDIADQSLNMYSLSSGTAMRFGFGAVPDVSRDGSRVVYLASPTTDSAHLEIVSTDGFGDTVDLGFAGLHPRWSPDDRKILAFEYDPLGDIEDIEWTPVIYDVVSGTKVKVGERGVLGFWVEDVR